MRYGIFGDIHGNLEALETVLQEFSRRQIDRYVCVGDIVGYGANPLECVEIIKDLKALCVMGNHEWAVLGKSDISQFNPIARPSLLWTRQQLKPKQLRFLRSLPFEIKNQDLVVVHGTLHDPERFAYMYTSFDAAQTFEKMDRKICFIGHTHFPRIWSFSQSEIKYFDSLSVTCDPGHKYIIDVGSVGQPRDGNAKSAYVVYDSQTRAMEIKRVIYPLQKAQQKIMEAGLPPLLALRLSIGQ